MEQLVAQEAADTAAVILYDPADCFSCYRSFSQWMRLKAVAPDRVFLILTREPTPAERQALLRARVTIDGILASPRETSSVPSEALFIDGHLERYHAHSDSQLLPIFNTHYPA